MASRVDYILNLNGDQARKVLLDLHRQGNNLFSKKGYELKLNAKGFNRSLDQATDRVLAFTAATVVLSTVGAAMRRLATDAISVETAISKIQSILNATQSDLRGFTNSIFDLANKTGVSFADAASAAEEFSRQGLSLEKTLKATEAALGLARVSGGNLAKTVQDLVAITSAFGNEALVYSDVADQLGALDAAFSTTTTGLAEGLARVASIANDVGVSFKEMSSLIASTKQVTGRTEAVIGNAFKSIFTNIGTDAVQEELRAIGVETRNLDGTFVDAEKVIQRLAAAYKNLTDAEQANITFKVAGKYNKNILQGAIFAEQEGVTKKALEVAGDAAGSIGERLKVLNDTTETSIQRLNNAITQLGSTEVGGLFASITKEFSQFATDAVNTLNKVFDKENPIGAPLGKALTAGISSVLTGPALVLGAALIGKIILKVGADLLRAGKTVFQTNKSFQSQKDILTLITAELRKQNVLLTSNSALASGKASKAGIQSGINPNYFPNTIAGGGRFTPNTTPIAKPNRLNPKYSQVGNSRFSSLPMNYLTDMKAYQIAVAKQAAQNAAGQKQFSKGKLARIEAYQNTPLQGGFFGISKREKAFARLQGVSENQQAVKDRIAQSRGARSEKIRSGAFGASFLAPLIGSGIGSAIGGTSGRVTSAVGEGLGITALGAAFGPVGLAAGLVAGSFKILNTVTEELFGQLGEVNQKIVDNINSQQKQKDAGDAYVLAQREFTEALKTGESALIEKARKDLEDAAGGLTGGFRELVGESDPSKLNALNEQLKSSVESLQAASLAAVEANNLVAKAYESNFDKFKSFFGDKKSVSRDSSAAFITALAKFAGTKNLGDSISSVSNGFEKTGDTGRVQNFVQRLIGTAPKELQESFSKLVEEFEGGKEALSLYAFEALDSQEKLKKLNREQQKTTQVTINLQDAFKKVISRSFGDSERSAGRAFSAAKSRLKGAEILDLAGTGDVARSLEQLNLSAKEEAFGLRSGFAKEVSTTLASSVQSSGDASKLAEFVERFAKGNVDTSSAAGFKKEIENLGFVNPGKTKELNDKFGELSKSLSDLVESVSRSKEEIISEAKAREDARIKQLELNRFGQIGEDQSGFLSQAEKGRKALKAAEELRAKTSSSKTANLRFGAGIGEKVGAGLTPLKFSESQAKDILDAIDAEISAGRDVSFNKDIETLATKTLLEGNAAKQASSVVGSKISEILGGEKFQSPFVKAQNEKIQKDVIDQLAKGDFKKAREAASNFNLSGSNKESIFSAIASEQSNFGKAGATAAERVNIRRSKDGLDSIQIPNNIEAPVIAPKDISRGGGEVNILSTSAIIGTAEEEIKRKQAELVSIENELAKIRKNEIDFRLGVNKATSPVGQESALAREIKSNQSFIDKVGQFTAEGLKEIITGGKNPGFEFAPDGLAGAELSKQDRRILDESKNVEPGQKRSEFLLKELGATRFQQLREGVIGKEIPGFENRRFDKSSLEKDASRIESEIKAKEAEKAKAIEEQKRLEKSATSLETTATLFKTAVDAFSQGTTQTISANVNVGVTGGDFVSTPDAQSQIEGTVKSLFVKYYKEITGKEPALLPTATA